MVSPTSRQLCQSTMNKKRRQRYAEKKLAHTALEKKNDSLLLHALCTPGGKSVLPNLAAHIDKGSDAHFERLVENTRMILRTTGGRHKQELAHLLVEGLPAKFCRQQLCMTQNFVDQARRKPSMESHTDRFGRENTKAGLSNAKYPVGVNRCKLSQSEETLLTLFFVRTTYVASGANRKTRILAKMDWEWEMQLFADYPMELRRLAQRYPDLVPDVSNPPTTGWTELQANILAAMKQCKDPTFDPDAERTRRRQEWRKTYVQKLLRKQGYLPKLTQEEKETKKQRKKDRAQARLHPREFDAEKYEVRGVKLKTLKTFLERAGLRYTQFHMPHPCPLCDDGDCYEERLRILMQKKTDAGLADSQTQWTSKQEQELTEVRKFVRTYRLHLDQLAYCREDIKRLEQSLKVGEAIVIRDFVNHHDTRGKHVKCLHWVKMWRDEPGGELKHLKLRHYCSDPESMMTDSYFAHDVMRFHLKKESPHNPGLFDDIKLIYFVGDHGPHFASAATMYKESEVWKIYEKEIRLKFYASYHAYGRADGAGAEDAVQARRDAKAGLPRLGAGAYTEMTNESHDRRSWAYFFPKIDRDLSTFPDGVNAKSKYLRKWCEVKFEFEERSHETLGICQYRLVTGKGVWKWCDLLAGTRPDGKTLCEGCSTSEKILVYHTPEECPSPDSIHALPTYRDCQPDPGRINEANQRSRPRRRGEKETTTYPCKIEGCINQSNKRRFFRKPETANRHFKLVHKLSGESLAAVAYPVMEMSAVEMKAKDKKATRRRKRKKPSNKLVISDDDESDESSSHNSESDEKNDRELENDDTDENFVVEEIIAHRKIKGKQVYEYQVKWEGYEDTTWEPAASFVGDCDLFEKYLAKVRTGKKKK